MGLVQLDNAEGCRDKSVETRMQAGNNITPLPINQRVGKHISLKMLKAIYMQQCRG